MLHQRIKWLMVMLLVFQMIVPAPVLAAAVGQFTSVVGDVTVTRAGVTSRPVAKSPIEEKDLVITGARATAQLVFEDDSTISLAQNSRFEVREFQVKGDARKGLFALVLGNLMADVRKFIGGQSYFEVHTPTAIAGVRGTGFEVAVAMVGGQMTTTVSCTVGALSVSAMSTTGAIVATSTVVAGQTAVVTATGITVSTAAAGAAGTSAAAGSTSGSAGAGTAAGTGAGTGAAGTGAATTTGTAAATTTGTAAATTTGAAAATTTGAAAATTAGAAAGATAAAGVTAGTVAAGVAVAAAAVAAVAEATGTETPTVHHTTTVHH